MLKCVVRVCCWLCVVFSLLFLNIARAELDDSTILVVGADWPGFINTDGSGEYLNHVRLSFPPEFDVVWDVSEFIRAKRLFTSGRADILIGVHRDNFPDYLFPNRPLDTDHEVLAFYVDDNISIQRLLDLEGKIVGWKNGYSFASLVPKSVEYVGFDDIPKAFTLLDTGKIDVLLDYHHNVPKVFEKRFSYFEVLPKTEIWLAFQDSPKGRKLLQVYEESITNRP